MKRLLAVLLAVLGLSASLFAATTINLSKDITAGRKRLFVGDDTTLTGSLSVPSCQILIKPGARVTLDEALIYTDENSSGAPITCLGDATLVVKGRWNNAIAIQGPAGHPGIYVPKDYTLTIEGDGVLTAIGAENGAGIGCGNLSEYGGELRSRAAI